MCTPTIAAAAVVVPLVVGGARAAGGKPPLGADIAPRPKVPKVEPPPDLAGEEKRRRARSIQRTLAGRPGRGRAATVFGGARTGSGPTGLKTATGQ